MEVGNALLAAAFLFTLFDLLNLSRARWRKKKPDASNAPFALATLFVALAYLRLVYAYVTDEFRLAEVFYTSASTLSTFEKIAASWAGAGSSYLHFLTLTATIFLACRVIAGFGKTHEDFSLKRRAYMFSSLIFLALLALTTTTPPFAELPVELPEGQGLNPMLRDIFMIFHPPPLFVGYIFTFMATSYALSSLSLRRRLELKEVATLTRLAWLFLMLGIAIGGVWAYITLGWGGYWAWDPIEVAPLIAWLFLTACFHLPAIRGKDCSLEFLLFLSFLSCLFTIFITRSGVVASIHAFAASPIGYGLVVMMALFTIIFAFLKSRYEVPIFDLRLARSVRAFSSFLAFSSLMVLAFICFIGTLMAIPALDSPEYYNMACFPFTILFLASLIGCSFPKRLGFKGYSYILCAVFTASIALTLLRFPTPNDMANFGIPIASFALAVIFARMLSSIARRERAFPYIASSGLIHAGLGMMLLGAFVSSTALLCAPHQAIRLGEPNVVHLWSECRRYSRQIVIEAGELHVGEPEGQIFNARIMRLNPDRVTGLLDVKIRDGANVYHTQVIYYLYSLFGMFFEPGIVFTPLYDYYLVPIYSEEMGGFLYDRGFLDKPIEKEEVRITVKMMPLVSLIWLGMILQTAGSIMAVATERRYFCTSQPK